MASEGQKRYGSQAKAEFPVVMDTFFSTKKDTRWPSNELCASIDMLSNSEEYRVFLAIYGATLHVNSVILNRTTTQQERVGMFVTSLRQHIRGIGVSEDAKCLLLKTDNWEDVGIFNSRGSHFCQVPNDGGYSYSRRRTYYGSARKRIADLTPYELKQVEGTMLSDQIETLARYAKERAEENPELEMQQSFANAQAALKNMKTLASEATTINVQAEQVVSKLCVIAEALA